ncbi:YkgJ family cysteine cluster protein [Reichenbachiella carrageenanivorans]|uniref:YkgJ family cysteine cluster protein n=1 Tax=Reichenbachiella carrageenanivorans TaxID=2979869 RepID=A0ABY6CWM0_9BACT|nr:YkgJ family cysteine cluster protein [Reichenbachiella carrageenanivorans]UXX78326.1 YkgJ family cysteine cluster protein [Reichenbachiella carrageenanivorans]
MSIVRKVKSIQRLFRQLDQEILTFNTHANLHCLSGCGKCCSKPDISVSPLEFLPWAFHLFKTRQIDDTLLALEQSSLSICHIYNPLSITDQNHGNCGDYIHRGLMCRLFGYGASRNKLGQLTLATCKIIKEGQKDNYNEVVSAINQGLKVPIFTDYYMRLAQIDIKLGNMILPINEALIVAIEEVLQHYAYRPFPKGYNAA